MPNGLQWSAQQLENVRERLPVPNVFRAKGGFRPRIRPDSRRKDAFLLVSLKFIYVAEGQYFYLPAAVFILQQFRQRI